MWEFRPHEVQCDFLFYMLVCSALLIDCVEEQSVVSAAACVTVSATTFTVGSMGTEGAMDNC